MNETLYRYLTQRYPNVSIVMASKYLTLKEDFDPFIKNRCYHFGENRFEVLALKKDMLADEKLTWHFIGTLQTKKVKKALPYIDILHSLDRLKLADEIEQHHHGILPCYIQVNISKETQKHGFDIEEVESFINQIKNYKHIEVIGLMGMATETNDEVLIREEFRSLRQLRDLLSKKYPKITGLSMGMSQDYHIALEEGATVLRLGRILLMEDAYE